MATKVQEKEDAQEAPPEAPDGPLLDLSDAAVKKMIKAAKKRGYVTYDELNAVLPSDQNSSDQIEDIYAMLSEMGINVIESEEAEEADSNSDDENAEGRELAETSTASTAVAKTAKEPTDRTDDPVRMYLREMG
ncbi:RNA polymerase sigma factor region1.1 domain-containing protein, partial [Bauldia litoralis]